MRTPFRKRLKLRNPRRPPAFLERQALERRKVWAARLADAVARDDDPGSPCHE